MVNLLEGIRVLSFNHFLMGPVGVQFLADLGADVIAIEPPEGEMMRVLAPITSPSMLNSGPPELPRLMLASVWM